MKDFRYEWAPTTRGLCRVCGKDNRSPIHEKCKKHSPKAKTKKAYTESQITNILRNT